MAGTIESIFVAENSGDAMRTVEVARAVAGRGIAGDRKFRDASKHPLKDAPDREITLIEIESVDSVNRDYALHLEAVETRRNLVTRGVALNHLVGKEFSVGNVRMRGLRLCEPCKRLEKMTRPGMMRALIHRGGLRAEILSGGEIRVGDSVS